MDGRARPRLPRALPESSAVRGEHRPGGARTRKRTQTDRAPHAAWSWYRTGNDYTRAPVIPVPPRGRQREWAASLRGRSAMGRAEPDPGRHAALTRRGSYRLRPEASMASRALRRGQPAHTSLHRAPAATDAGFLGISTPESPGTAAPPARMARPARRLARFTSGTSYHRRAARRAGSPARRGISWPSPRRSRRRCPACRRCCSSRDRSGSSP